MLTCDVEKLFKSSIVDKSSSCRKLELDGIDVAKLTRFTLPLVVLFPALDLSPVCPAEFSSCPTARTLQSLAKWPGFPYLWHVKSLRLLPSLPFSHLPDLPPLPLLSPAAFYELFCHEVCPTPRLLIAIAFATVCTFLSRSLTFLITFTFVLAFRATFALALLAFFFLHSVHIHRNCSVPWNAHWTDQRHRLRPSYCGLIIAKSWFSEIFITCTILQSDLQIGLQLTTQHLHEDCKAYFLRKRGCNRLIFSEWIFKFEHLGKQCTFHVKARPLHYHMEKTQRMIPWGRLACSKKLPNCIHRSLAILLIALSCELEDFSAVVFTKENVAAKAPADQICDLSPLTQSSFGRLLGRIEEGKGEANATRMDVRCSDRNYRCHSLSCSLRCCSSGFGCLYHSHGQDFTLSRWQLWDSSDSKSGSRSSCRVKRSDTQTFSNFGPSEQAVL